MSGKSGTRSFWIAALMVWFCLGVIPVANAYIDPGTGSYIFQIVIGGLLAGGLFLKTFWRRIRALFGGRARGEE